MGLVNGTMIFRFIVTQFHRFLIGGVVSRGCIPNLHRKGAHLPFGRGVAGYWGKAPVLWIKRLYRIETVRVEFKDRNY